MDYSLEFSCSQQLLPFQAIQTTPDEAKVCCLAVALEDKLSAMEELNMIEINHDVSLKLLHWHTNYLRNFHLIHKHLRKDIDRRTMMMDAGFDRC